MLLSRARWEQNLPGFPQFHVTTTEATKQLGECCTAGFPPVPDLILSSSPIAGILSAYLEPNCRMQGVFKGVPFPHPVRGRVPSLNSFFFLVLFLLCSPPAPPSVVWWQEDESEAKTSANGKSAIWHPLCSWHPKDTSHQIILCSWSSWACSFMARTSLPCLEACLKEERHHYAFTTVGTGWGQVDNFDGTKCAPYDTLLCLLGRKQKASWELQQHGSICSCTIRVPMFQSHTGPAHADLLLLVLEGEELTAD